MKPQPTMTPEQEAEWERRAREGSLFAQEYSEVGPALRERYPDGLIPWGAQAALADELGLSRATVSSAAKRLEFTTSGRPVAPHGTRARYQNSRCRCQPCTVANSVDLYNQIGWPKRSKYDHLRPEAAS